MAAKAGLETKSAPTSANQNVQLLGFRLDDQEYALNVAQVVQVVRMVAITRAPKAPEVVEGMINLRGKVIPVISLRKRFALGEKPLGLNDHLLIAQSDGHTMALLVDVVSEVLTIPTNTLDAADEVGPQLSEFLSAVAKLGDRLVLILDLNKVLTLD
jgi:purine-binding chemotaxis protein CheW